MDGNEEDDDDEEDESEITFHYVSILSKINVIHFVADKERARARSCGRS